MAQPATETIGVPLPGPATLEEGVRLATTGRMDEARACFERILQADPGNADACNNLGTLHMQTGNLGAGVEMFERALKLSPLDPEVRSHCCAANLMLGTELTKQNRRIESIPHYRRVLALEPGNQTARVNLTDALAVTGTRAEPGDFMVAADSVLGSHALIACMPKSGSSLLFETVHRLTGWEKAQFSYAYYQNEQELYLPLVLEVAGRNTVTQQHCRATESNIQIMQGLGLRPIVLVRNLADIVMSLVDFYDHGAVFNTFVAAEWGSLTSDAKRDYVIDHVMPWYVAFYVSWKKAAAGRLDCLFVRYEDMIADKPGTLAAVASYLGLNKTAEECRAAVDAGQGNRSATRFNKGVAGRGAASLGDEQLARLKRLTVPYASTDFAPIGL